MIRIKLVLIGLAGLNAAYFHFRVRKSIDEWNVGKVSPASVKIAGLVSILLWISIIASGRLIAYL